MKIKELLSKLELDKNIKSISNEGKDYHIEYPAEQYVNLVIKLDKLDQDNFLNVINTNELENSFYIDGVRFALYVNYDTNKCKLTIYNIKEID